MKGRFQAHLGKAALVTLVVALALGLSAAVGIAQEVDIDDERLIIDLGGQVYAENCDPCHADISDTDNFSDEIIFEHGYHQLIACSSCHTRFPHRREGTEVPTMKGCFDCHGLQHGPVGELATGECEECHNTLRARLRPEFHGRDWAGTPHVEPSLKELNTKCMMCHDGPFCDECHEEEDIDWEPETNYNYDAEDGCLACHGDENLTKTSQGQPKSFQVVGVMDSAHADVTCQQCHKDYEYEGKEKATPLWNVNAGLACMDCHDHDEQSTIYMDSIHGQELANGDLEAATCASCHGGHFIQRLDTEYAKRTLQGSAYRMCARCHRAEYESYDDYYHGAAYKRGATDAPACWDCHGAHEVLPTSDPDSLMSDQNRADTCGQEGCHAGSDYENPAFAEAASSLIHQQVDAAAENPLRQVLIQIGSWLG
jgi:hypothetical protein